MKISPLSIGTLHFIGIGGIGMSGLAQILHNLGQTVQGSDTNVSPNVKRLQKDGIPVFGSHEASNIDKADIVVISTAIRKNNPEYQAALEKKIPIIHRSDLLAQLLRLRWSVSIAGSHGKTTTTSLMAALFDAAGLDPTVINGGIINTYGSNARLGKGEWMIAEADESDGSFLKIHSTIGVVTNIDEEHMDYYNSYKELVDSFKSFINNIPYYGFAVLGIDHSEVYKLSVSIVDKQVITYGFREEAQIRGESIGHTPEGMVFDVCINLPHMNRSPFYFRKLKLKMLGVHNVNNALAIIAVAIRLDIPEKIIRCALSTFGGVNRRLTLVGETSKGALIYDDYAHHPKEIRAVLDTLKISSQKKKYSRLIAVFQPHRYSRLQHLYSDFLDSFSEVDFLYIMPVYSAGEEPIDGVNHQIFAKDMGKKYGDKFEVRALATEVELYSQLKTIAKDGDIIVFMGAGSITLMAANFFNFSKEDSRLTSVAR